MRLWRRCGRWSTGTASPRPPTPLGRRQGPRRRDGTPRPSSLHRNRPRRSRHLRRRPRPLLRPGRASVWHARALGQGLCQWWAGAGPSVASSVAGSYRGGFSTVGSQSLYTAHSTGRTYDATPPPRTHVFDAAATTGPWAARARHRLPRPPSPFRPGRP